MSLPSSGRVVDGLVEFYVPDDLVDEYKYEEKWDTLKAHIHGLSELS